MQILTLKRQDSQSLFFVIYFYIQRLTPQKLGLLSLFYSAANTLFKITKIMAFIAFWQQIR
ncbi:hypothetical protein ykris0001_33390 [Yersinia kristensenii ATCC 33638]|nr:hypothetical protein ykris0001_33390 [Yersinia kristensenii ATCC 33638]